MESDESVSDSTRPVDSGVTRLAYHNGSWINADDVCLSSRDPAVTQAVTAVERVRAYNGRLFELDRHLDRWQRTTKALDLTGLPSRPSLSRLIDEAIARNGAWLARQKEFGVLWFATPGTADSPTLVIDLYPIDSALIERRTRSGSLLVVTSVQQPPSACWSRNIKVRCRLHYYLADREARQTDSDAIGILVDSDGTVTESSIANLLIVEAGGVVCPPSDQILSGVSLQVVRELASEIGITWREQRISRERLAAAEEVLLTGTSCGIWFANSIDRSPLRAAGPVYQRLRSAFEGRVG
ncbi:aminotransferase class IV [Planctomycetes bacterium TBK1r]|uniref:Branched-chain-amino-acid aminotransferase n=1 Tax=Stieleria magnilauensis TaxID=2527963 RepID=A0ABX5XKK0_9BACT|nr:Branched-chain-amino-acid aminotransferase [Planctomycetes bacterium TBK1r]